MTTVVARTDQLGQKDGGWTEAEASDVLGFSVKALADQIEWP